MHYNVLCSDCGESSVWTGHSASGSGVCLDGPLHDSETCPHLPDAAEMCEPIDDED